VNEGYPQSADGHHSLPSSSPRRRRSRRTSFTWNNIRELGKLRDRRHGSSQPPSACSARNRLTTPRAWSRSKPESSCGPGTVLASRRRRAAASVGDRPCSPSGLIWWKPPPWPVCPAGDEVLRDVRNALETAHHKAILVVATLSADERQPHTERFTTGVPDEHPWAELSNNQRLIAKATGCAGAASPGGGSRLASVGYLS
jgi:hypothetical protein